MNLLLAYLVTHS